MRIQHNISALNSHRQLGMNNNAVAKNLEKLSSGYAINRAADNAAGLAISEKMRGQIRGLDQAQANAQDGISLIQTAEGALNETHDILQRMRELSVQSANGTYQNDVDRENIQKEVDALKGEIDRIASSTHYNKINLLDGSLTTKTVTSGAYVDPNAKELMGPVADNSSGVSGSVVDTNTTAIAQKSTFSMTAGTAATMEGYKFTFKNKEGIEKSFTLTEKNVNLNANADGTLGVADKLQKAIQNGDDSVFELKGGNDAVLAEFNELFDVSAKASAAGGGAGFLTVTAKETGINKASFSGVKEVTAASAPAVDTALGTAADVAIATLTGGDATDVDLVSKKAEASGVTITVGTTAGNAAAADKNTIKIGDKIYEYDTAGDGVADGHAAITGNDAEKQTASLLAQLKADGYEAHIDLNADGTAKNTIRITSLDKLSKAQTGTQISATGTGVQVKEKEATYNSGSLTITAGAAAAGTNSMTVRYKDKDGIAQEKTLDYSVATANANTDVASGIKAAIDADDTLKDLFTVTNNGAGGLTLTAKQSGSEGASLTSLDVRNSTTGAMISSNVTATAATDAGKTVKFTSELKVGDKITLDGKDYSFVADADAKAALEASGGNAIIWTNDPTSNMANFAAEAKKNGVNFSKNGDTMTIYNKDNMKETKEEQGGLTFQIGANGSADQRVSLSVEDMSTKGVGVANISVSTQTAANKAIDIVDAAINTVSKQRAGLGALQNRLEHTVNNLGTTSENLTSSEARIRDVDMAKEMVNMSKNNILTQAAQAMLAQANTQPQGVLQLLK